MASPGTQDRRLLASISGAIVDIYDAAFDPVRTTATTYLNDNVVVCILEDVLRAREEGAEGSVAQALMDERGAFQRAHEKEFIKAVETLTERRVVAFMSANQTSPGVAAELRFLEPAAAGGDGETRTSAGPRSRA